MYSGKFSKHKMFKIFTISTSVHETSQLMCLTHVIHEIFNCEIFSCEIHYASLRKIKRWTDRESHINLNLSLYCSLAEFTQKKRNKNILAQVNALSLNTPITGNQTETDRQAHTHAHTHT